ncbi:MAG TPA: tetratricopeptide repeat protein, partial [Actinophytocola sp.]
LAAARRAADLAPREARPHEVLGDAAARAGDVASARKAYRDALRLDPGNAQVRARLDRIDSRGRPAPVTRPPSARRPAVRPARFGLGQRTALWLLVRRVATWLAVGSFLLLIAGLPSPSPLLVWVGLGLVLFVLGLAAHGWLGLPPGARAGIAVLRRAEPLIVTCAVLLAVALLALAGWTLALAFGSRDMQLLNVGLAGSGISLGLAWLGLWRLKLRTR